MSISFDALKGKEVSNVKESKREVLFETKDGEKYKLKHFQDCCENVYVEDINGDLSDLIDSKIVSAVEASSGPQSGGYGTETYTFYHLRTHKGDVTIRFHGTSNGYYSEKVDFVKIT